MAANGGMELRPQAMIFVHEYMKNGNNSKQAAIVAGYSERSAASQGSRLLKSADVKQYLNKYQQNVNKDLRQLFAEHAVNAFEVLLGVMNDPDATDKDKLVASRDLLDRAGYKAIDRVVSDVNTEGQLNVVFSPAMQKKVE